jgi:phosphoglycerate dehydrogenase-like enzyme
MRVVFRSPVLRDQLEGMARRHGVTFVAVDDTLTLHREAANADALWLWPAFYDAALVPVLEQHTPRLGWLQLMTMGYDRIEEFGAARGIAITNAADAYAPTVAEHAVTLLLALMRRIPDVVRTTDAGRWETSVIGRIRTLNEAHVAVVGFGNIGQAIASRLRALGATVAAVTRRGSPHPLADESVRVADLLGLLPRCDGIVLACPLTPQTRGLIDAAALAALPPHAVLVNIARGPIVDHPALTEALFAGRLGGAGLDVTDPEPLPQGDPLWATPNLIVSPHAAGYGGDVPGKRATAIVERNLLRYRAGQPLDALVPVTPRADPAAR